MLLRSFLKNFEEYFSNLALAGLVAVLFLQVFFRYVLHTGLSWTEEISRFLFVGFVYVSASYAVQRGTHIRVSVIVDLLPLRLRKLTAFSADALWVVFNAIVAISGILLVARMIEHPVYSTSLFLPLSLIYLVIPMAHILMICRIIGQHIGNEAARGEARPEVHP